MRIYDRICLRIYCVIFSKLGHIRLIDRTCRFWWISSQGTRSCNFFYDFMLVIASTIIWGQTSILCQLVRWMYTFPMTSCSCLFIVASKTFILLFFLMIKQIKPVACNSLCWLQSPLFLIYLILSLQQRFHSQYLSLFTAFFEKFALWAFNETRFQQLL